MSLFATPEIEDGKITRIFASAKYPSRQIGNLFFDCDLTPNLKYADEMPLKLNGFYSLIAFRPSHILLSRDVLGGKPLYYNPVNLAISSFKEFCSNSNEVVEVSEGEVLKIDYDGSIVQRRVYYFHDVFKRFKMDGSAELVKELMETIEKSLLNFKPKHSCIAFSGGVDSSLLAAMYDLQLVAVTANEKEKEWIKKAAKEIGRDLEIFIFDEKDVKGVLPEITSLIETHDAMQVSIAIPIYFTTRFAKELGYNRIVFGQGADELFGGYKRYEMLNEFELEEQLELDVRRIGRNNLIRDNKIAYGNEIKIETPYLQWDVIKAAINIPPNYKVRRDDGVTIRKYALRKIASKYLPKEIAHRDKKAVQYSTKTKNLLFRIARREGKKIKEYLDSLKGDAKDFWF
ncbi:asparagine synthetase B [Archaeoglobales archaeon]|nr:MAG: asparagine synthetase B [Archaeoglobales archaeon]